MRRVGILVCGCGVYDGSDVQEAVLLAAALEARGLRSIFIAPAGDQAEVVDHTTGDVAEGAAPRNILAESARVARGSVRPLDEILAGELDALVIPGGVGVARNLCLPDGGPLGGGDLRPEVVALLQDLAQRKAPVAALGLGHLVLRRFEGVPLGTDVLAIRPGEVIREDGGRVLIAAGFLGSSSIAEVAATIATLADEIAARLKPAATLRIRSDKERSA